MGWKYFTKLAPPGIPAPIRNVIHDLAYRRNSLRRNFYQIQILFCRKLLSVPCGHKTELTSVGTDYSDFLVTDFFIDLKLLAILVSYGEHPQNIKLNYK